MNIKIPKFLTNKYVLYLVVFLSLTNMFGYLAMANINALIYFLIIGLVTSIFTQNMCIILLSALILSNILIAGQNSFEGFTGETDEQEPKKPISNGEKKSKMITPVSADEAEGEGEFESSISTTEMDTQPSNQLSNVDESFEVNMGNGNKKKYPVDYSSSIEDAYGPLDNDGIKRLTEDTQKLLKQQLQLADVMKTMAPLINNIKPLIEQSKGMMDGVGGLDMKNLGGLASSAKSFMPTNI
jgi:hypothetical protein